MVVDHFRHRAGLVTAGNREYLRLARSDDVGIAFANAVCVGEHGNGRKRGGGDYRLAKVRHVDKVDWGIVMRGFVGAGRVELPGQTGGRHISSCTRRIDCSDNIPCESITLPAVDVLYSNTKSARLEMVMVGETVNQLSPHQLRHQRGTAQGADTYLRLASTCTKVPPLALAAEVIETAAAVDGSDIGAGCRLGRLLAGDVKRARGGKGDASLLGQRAQGTGGGSTRGGHDRQTTESLFLG